MSSIGAGSERDHLAHVESFLAGVPDDHPLCGRAARDAIAGASSELLSEPLLGAPT